MADLKISQLSAATTPLAGTEVVPLVQSSTTKKVSVDNLTAGKNVPVLRVTASFPFGKPATSGTTQPGGLALTSPDVFTSIYAGVSDAAPYNAWIQAAQRNDLSVSYELMINPNGGDISFGANLVPKTAAKGVNFTANTPAAGMTSQLLNWYEEGTWTPVVEGGTTPGTGTYTTQVGRYTRIGNTVNLNCALAWSAHTGTGVMIVSGLPFTAATVTGLQWTGTVFASNMDFGAGATSIVAIVTSAGTTIIFRGLVNNAVRTNPTLDTSVDTLAISLTYQAA